MFQLFTDIVDSVLTFSQGFLDTLSMSVEEWVTSFDWFGSSFIGWLTVTLGVGDMTVLSFLCGSGLVAILVASLLGWVIKLVSPLE